MRRSGSDLCRRRKPPAAITVTVYEIDPLLVRHLRETLDHCRAACTAAGVIKQPLAGPGRDIRQAAGNLPLWEGAGASDLAVCTRKDLTLRRGEKAMVTLFTRKISYNHCYRWSPAEDLRHFLMLPNDTDTPWTTRPCLVISDQNALSEDLLRYVPRGVSGELPVTIAVNITHGRQETEAARKLKAYEPSSHFFVDLVTIEGELSFRNHEQRPVELIVHLPVEGKPISASDDARITLEGTNLKPETSRTNRNHRMEHHARTRLSQGSDISLRTVCPVQVTTRCSRMP